MTTATLPNAAPKLDVNQQIAALAKSGADNAVLLKGVLDSQRAISDLLEKGRRPNYGRGRTPGELFNDGNAPHARVGEDPLSSRPYSFAKALGYIREITPDEDCKVELGLNAKLSQIYCQANGYHKSSAKAMLIPLSSELMKATIDYDMAMECKQLTKGGRPTDYEEVAWYARKFGQPYVQKTMSWIDESLGASTVPPPQLMELIELLRNNAALLAAGASEIGMPPNGRAIWPRQTSAAQGVWLGEGQSGTPSDQGTGDLILTAKKAAAFTRVNNELFKFSGINVEQFIRNDLAKVLGLLIDKTGLEGSGSNFSPKGLINYDNITKYTASVTGANGNTIQPQDIPLMIAAVYGKNAKFASWILRPELWGLIQSKRWDTITAGDGAGGFVWGLLQAASDKRDIELGASYHLGGHKMVQSTNVSNARTKGSGTALSYILGGDFPDYKVAMSGVVEISLATQGDAIFLADQTMVRAINYCDMAPAHEASFVFCDTLVTGPQ
jgi:HK97 family phage major capsid protein